MHGEPLDAGGDMIALRCPRCNRFEEAHDCIEPRDETGPWPGEHPADAKRRQYDIEYKKAATYGASTKERRWEVADKKAKLISSELKGDYQEDIHGLDQELHSPVLDIDFAARLIPSSTPGHFHLYLDGLHLSWEKYARLLTALAEAGVIEKGYAGAAIRRKATFVWKPGCKPAEAARPDPF